MRIVLTIATLCAALSGCGQKGPLFMPDENGKPTSKFASPAASQFISPSISLSTQQRQVQHS